MEKILYDIRQDAIAKMRERRIPTEKELAQMTDMVCRLSFIGKIAKAEGLLAVEEQVDQIEGNTSAHLLVKQMGELIVSGLDPELTLDIMSAYYWVENPKGYEAITLYMGIQGMSLIQNGCNPYNIYEFMKPYFSKEDWSVCLELAQAQIDDYEHAEFERKKKEFDERDRQINNLELIDKIHLCEENIRNMDQAQMSLFMRNVDNNRLCTMLTIVDHETVSKVMDDNMSERLAEMIVEDIVAGWKCLDEARMLEDLDVVLTTMRMAM